MATVSLWQRTPRLDADVAIVGGGIIGTATAWALHRLDPTLRVAILEAERLADMLSRLGLAEVDYRRLGFGTVALHWGIKVGQVN